MLRRLKSRISLIGSQPTIPGSQKNEFNTSAESWVTAIKIHQQRRTRGIVLAKTWIGRIALTIVGVGWLLLLPSDLLGKESYVDENAIQPGQVTTYWDWGDVHTADLYLNDLERLWSENATSQHRADYLRKELSSLGLETSSQEYEFKTLSETVAGTNVYSYLSTPRSSGTETVLLSAPLLSLSSSNFLEEPAPNLRGVSLLLALAKFLRGQNHWAKDFIFLFADGKEDGIEAFLASYHGVEIDGLNTAILDPSPQGVVWQALNIDYPGHSFSHLGLFYEGTNGRLANQDLLNSVAHISRWTGYAPVRLYDLVDEVKPLRCQSSLPKFVCKMMQSGPVSAYKRSAAHIIEHFKYAAVGRSSGGHGAFAKYRIDAVTLFAVPAVGPHGFHCLGIIIESSLRSLSNILERLHASYFFYLLPRSSQFLAVGAYLPAAVLLGASVSIGGLEQWTRSGWVLAKAIDDGHGKDMVWQRRDRGIPTAMRLLALSAVVGSGLLWAGTTGALVPQAMVISLTAPMTPLSSYLISRFSRTTLPASMAPRTLLSVAHLLAGAMISTLAMLNFPQAVLTAGLLAPSLLIAELSVGRDLGHSHLSKTPKPKRKIDSLAALALLSPGGFVLLCLTAPVGLPIQDLTAGLLKDWKLSGSYFMPGLLGVCWPLQLAASVVVWSA